MKKILSLILVITCFGLLMSCDMLSSITGGGNGGAKGIDAFVTAIENTNPKNITVDIEWEDGKLKNLKLVTPIKQTAIINIGGVDSKINLEPNKEYIIG